MADLEKMLNIGDLGTQAHTVATGAVVGGLIGGPVGAGIGGIVGTVASQFIPQYSHVKGSVSGVNFVNLKLKPYMISLDVPDDYTAKVISDYYCYFGCGSNRSEPLNIASYLYQNHAYVRGTLQYNGSIPLDKFQKIQQIFKSGTHILGS